MWITPNYIYIIHVFLPLVYIKVVKRMSREIKGAQARGKTNKTP